MSRLLDFILNLFKWPVALLSLLSLPALIKAFDYLPFANMRFFMFLGGAFAYFAFKFFAMARSNISMQILAHEFTHIFFALLTLHKVVHVHLNIDESGGAMSFKGKGNWLIVIGPYFFPLFLFFMIMGITFYSDRIPDGYWINGILGYFFAYHVESVMMQIHGEQPDFREVGFPFCWMFLPGANIFVCSIILIFNSGGWVLVEKYLQFIYKINGQNFDLILGYFTK